MAAEVHHAIDQRRATEPSPAWQRNAPAVHLILRSCRESPIERWRSLCLQHRGRDVDVRTATGAARLDQADAVARILRKARSEHTARRAAAHYDEIEAIS